MEAHGVHMSNWHRFIEFNFSDQHAICLNSRNREFEGSVAQTIVCWGRRGNCPDPQRAGLSMLRNMLGERSRTMILRDLPHTYSCTYFYSKEKQRWKQKGLYRFWTPGSLNFIQIKSEKCLKHQFFSCFFCFFNYFLFFCKDNPGYLPVVLGLRSQARPWGFILQLPWWCSSQLHHHLLIDHRSCCKVSAQIQLRALQRYYDKQNQIQPS